MKQNITKKQWNEITDDDKFEFWSNYQLEGIVSAKELSLPNIGEMIRFLGGSIDEISLCSDWQAVNFDNHKISRAKELADALWKAVKNKLNETTNK